MSQPVKFDAKFSLLTDEQKDDLKRWRANVEGEADGPKSLWIYGDRCSGTSYIGNCALSRMVTDHWDWEYEYYTAQKVMDARRTMWDISRQLPTDDPELMNEYLHIEEDFRYLWEKAQVIFIDNLHTYLDLGFWRNHVHQNLEERVKEGRVTILATSAAPTHSAFKDITRVIETHFVVVHGTR